jgi:hypothetical protein
MPRKLENDNIPGCSGCPAINEHGVNMGCLPSLGELCSYAKEGYMWSCHESPPDKLRPCAGFVDTVRRFPTLLPDMTPEMLKGPLLSYPTWYHQGIDAAKREADVRNPNGE